MEPKTQPHPRIMYYLPSADDAAGWTNTCVVGKGQQKVSTEKSEFGISCRTGHETILGTIPEYIRRYLNRMRFALTHTSASMG